MNDIIDELTRSVIDKNSLHECSVNELEELTRQYPYFGPAQFLLAKKLKEENSPRYEQQSQKAILFFQDHLWFDYLTASDDITVTITPTIQDVVLPKESPKESLTPEQQPVITTPEPERQMSAPPATELPTVEEEELVEPIISENLVIEAREEPVIQKEPESVPPVTEPAAEIEKMIDPMSGADLSDTDEEEPEDITVSQPPVKFPEFKIEPVDLTKPLTFEPYHTVDYFASQGIRMKEEEKPRDRFSQQLRSFTEWLKTMKKLPESEIAAPVAPAEDQQVTQMAEHSLADREVVTEAMADVWEKQGNHEKAIETYHKLSLLNPAKSSYFAAKIEQLKRG
jgi:hypothetical protein